MIDARVKYNELTVGKTYYSVCVGQIRPLRFKFKINKDKMMVYYPDSDYDMEVFYSDYGVIGCPTGGTNKLNCLFHTKEDADNYISTLDYNTDLLLHESNIAELDYLLYSIEDDK